MDWMLMILKVFVMVVNVVVVIVMMINAGNR